MGQPTKEISNELFLAMLQTNYKIDFKKYPRLSGVLLTQIVGIDSQVIVGTQKFTVVEKTKITFKSNYHTSSVSLTDGINYLMSKRDITKFLNTVGINSYGEFLQLFARNNSVESLISGINLELCKFSRYPGLTPII